MNSEAYSDISSRSFDGFRESIWNVLNTSATCLFIYYPFDSCPKYKFLFRYLSFPIAAWFKVAGGWSLAPPVYPSVISRQEVTHLRRT
jgi:hypothetical protein